MLKIRVLGVGAIPRNLGIAPKYEPFLADLDCINAIIGHGTLIPQVLNPNNGKFTTLNSQNLERYWKLWGNEKPEVKKSRVISKLKAEAKPATQETLKQVANEAVNEFIQKQEATPVETPKPVQQNQNNINNKKPNNVDNKKEDKKVEEKKPESTEDDGKITVISSSDKK